MPLSHRIKIFWDLVTCPIPTSYTSPGEVIRDIRLFTNRFGVVTSIKAYWDRNKTQLADDPLRAAMPSMGVNLVDCSKIQDYTDDALTTMLSVDLAISAMDDPMNQEANENNITIMVISGDKSILYPLSLLMLRTYTVFLVVPDDDTESFWATRIFCWYRDILGCGPSLLPASGPAAETPKTPGWVVNGIHIPQLSLDNPSTTRPLTYNGGPHWTPDQQSMSPKAKEAPQMVVSVKQQEPAHQVQSRDCGSVGDAQAQEVEVQALDDLPLSIFDPLVAVLEEMGSMVWWRLGVQLAKHKGLYQSAGVPRFGEFIALAVQKRIVSLHGTGNKRLVQLRNS